MELCLHSNSIIKGHKRRSCRLCRALYERKYRKTEGGIERAKRYNSKSKQHPGYKAKTAVYLAVRNKRLPRPEELKCFDCEKQAQVYDHRNYSKPLEVVPVCRSCNALRGPAIC